MPYATPSPTSQTTSQPASPLPVHSTGRPGHRRSYSAISFSDERGPGAFAPLAALPRRRTGSGPVATPVTPAGHKFHLEDEEGSSEDDDAVRREAEDTEEEREQLRLRLKVKTLNNFDADVLPSPSISQRRNQNEKQLLLPTIHTGVPFPRTSPTPSPLHAPAPAPAPPKAEEPTSPRPNFSRTSSTPVFSRSSTPILLSNGKPLKSSLKSSSSSPNIPFPAQSLVPSLYQHHFHHSRAASAPSTPHISTSPGEETPETQTQPTTPVAKNVHFPSQEEGGLATVRLFSRSAKPASLSKPAGEETETETETEGGFVGGYLRPTSVGGSNGYPFPRFRSSPLHEGEKDKVYEIDVSRSSAIPCQQASAHGNVFLESLTFNEPKTTPMGGKQPLSLSGTLVVRNLAYEKQVAVRFTLDEWQTTSEVIGKHMVSLKALPSNLSLPIPASTTIGDIIAVDDVPQWDRFGFTIRLEDYAPSLAERTMWLVVRYVAAGEWWDNNGGGNYKVGFKMKDGEEKSVISGALGRRTGVVSAPSAFQNAISAPQLTASASMPPYPSSSHTTTSYNSANAFPAPPSSTSAAQTTLERLKKLNLRNYAAPSAAPARTSSPTPPSTALQTPTEPLAVPGMTMMEGGYPATMTMAPVGASPPFSSMAGSVEGEKKGVFWSWGAAASAPTDKEEAVKDLPDLSLPLPPSLLLNIKEKSTSSPPRSPVRAPEPIAERTSSSESLSSSGSGSDRRPGLPRSFTAPPVAKRTSGSGSSSGSGSDSRRRRAAFGVGGTESPLRRSVLGLGLDTSAPAGSPRHSPVGSSSPVGGDKQDELKDPDAVYQAFVRQWCFAQGPAPARGAEGGMGMVVS